MCDPNDIVGKRIGSLTVLKHAGKPKRYHMYLCECSCGNRKVMLRQTLTGKRRAKSCGCVNKSNDTMGERSTTHGHSSTSIYQRWRNMIDRCKNKSSKKYHRYGARGIAVCERWHSFNAFLADVGYPPFQGATLDRIDVNGNYEPSNVRWANQKTQQNNRGNTRVLTIDGISKPVTEWAAITGVSPKVIRQRIDRDGLSPREAVYKGSHKRITLSEVIYPVQPSQDILHDEKDMHSVPVKEARD